MKKVAILALGVLALTGVFLVVKRSGRQNGKEVAGAEPASLKSELEKSLQIANPSKEDLLLEMKMLEEEARQAGEIPSAEDHVSAVSGIAQALANSPNPPVDRGYDLPALEARFLEALQNTNTQERRNELREIAIFLAGQDPDTASRFMKAILSTRDVLTDDDGYAFATEVVGELSKEDPVAAAAWMKILPERLQYPAHQLLARNWVARDPAALEAWTQKLENDGLRATVIRMMSQSLSSSDAAGFAPAWAMRLAQSEKDGSRLSEIVVKHWGKVDFDAAYAWAAKLENVDARDTGILALSNTRAQADAPAAAAWARDSLKGEVRAKAIYQAISAWLAKDPPAAAAWVDKLGEPTISNATFDMIAISWMRKDETKAEGWIQTAAVNQQRKDYVYTMGRQ